MPLVLAIFAPLLEWVAKFFADKSMAYALAAFMATAMLAYIGAIAAIVAMIGNTVPASIADVLNAVLPSQWAAQLATIGSIQATAALQRTWEKTITTFAQSQ
ncbi:hypothetical protein ACFPAG_09160 [Vogesella sp. GCM10023246]|uniref:Uncharacterized protein n=1 Tax=Vogesella oryzagri TaxID=3160864 RepID=A0ABV1M3H0_9NEIS